MAKILVVDDSNMLRDMLKFALQDGGYTDVTEAADGEEGLRKAQESQYDLVITDINMPKMNGFELVKALRQKESYAKSPLIVLTTEQSDVMKAKGREAGATGWIIKPFVPEQLLQVVGTVLK